MTGNDNNPFTLIYTPYGSLTAQTVKALQWKLNADGGYGLVIDGVYGPRTSAALERHLGWSGRAILWPGNAAYNAEVVTLQHWLTDVGGFPTTADGYWGSGTTTSLQLSLNSTRF